MNLRETWQTRADAWIRWSRSPELDDDFWRFHLPQFLGLLPPPGRLTVDMGCGEGRLGRVLAGAGHRVVGCDAAFAMVKAAAGASGACPAVVADAVMLPLRDRGADLVIAFMCLHDFDDMRAAVGEAARVLAPGGRLAVALLHPVVTARLAGTYAAERRYSVDTVEKAGLAMTYEGLHRPLTAYTAALADAGLVIEAIREPVKTDGDSVTMPFLDLLARRPYAHLTLRSAKPQEHSTMSAPDFTVDVFQNEYLPVRACEVNAIVTVSSAGSAADGPAAQWPCF